LLVYILLTSKEDKDFDDLQGKYHFDMLETLLSKLRSYIAHPPIIVSSNDTHHAMIVMILILECASISYASPSSPTLHESLDHAYSQYMSSDIHIAVKQQLSLSPNHYSVDELVEFVLRHRLR